MSVNSNPRASQQKENTSCLKFFPFIAGVVETGDQPLFSNIFRYFRKILYGLNGYSGAWGKLIHEKSLKSKILCQTPFKDRGSCAELQTMSLKTAWSTYFYRDCNKCFCIYTA
jgi:hypothetical protein